MRGSWRLRSTDCISRASMRRGLLAVSWKAPFAAASGPRPRSAAPVLSGRSMRSVDQVGGARPQGLVVALNLEWDDLGPERAALAEVDAQLVRADELRESQLSRVVALLSEGARVTADDLR